MLKACAQVYLPLQMQTRGCSSTSGAVGVHLAPLLPLHVARRRRATACLSAHPLFSGPAPRLQQLARRHRRSQLTVTNAAAVEEQQSYAGGKVVKVGAPASTGKVFSRRGLVVH